MSNPRKLKALSDFREEKFIEQFIQLYRSKKANARELLVLSENADDKEIRNNYKKLNQVFHPDKYKSNTELTKITKIENEEICKAITSAYEELTKGPKDVLQPESADDNVSDHEYTVRDPKLERQQDLKDPDPSSIDVRFIIIQTSYMKLSENSLTQGLVKHLLSYATKHLTKPPMMMPAFGISVHDSFDSANTAVCDITDKTKRNHAVILKIKGSNPTLANFVWVQQFGRDHFHKLSDLREEKVQSTTKEEKTQVSLEMKALLSDFITDLTKDYAAKLGKISAVKLDLLKFCAKIFSEANDPSQVTEVLKNAIAIALQARAHKGIFSGNTTTLGNKCKDLLKTEKYKNIANLIRFDLNKPDISYKNLREFTGYGGESPTTFFAKDPLSHLDTMRKVLDEINKGGMRTQSRR